MTRSPDVPASQWEVRDTDGNQLAVFPTERAAFYWSLYRGDGREVTVQPILLNEAERSSHGRQRLN